MHRNLKPTKIEITPDGKVKVLDFGLAKADEGTPERPVLAGDGLLNFFDGRELLSQFTEGCP